MMLPLHLSDQQFYLLQRCGFIWDLTVVTIECNICVPPQYSLDVTGDIEGFKINNSCIALVGTCESYFIGVDDLRIIISNIMFTLLKRDS